MSPIRFRREEKYEILHLIGGGGFGKVYRCRHRAFDEEHAVKVLNSEFLESAESLSRFTEEARIAREIKHPNVVRVIDFDQDEEGRHYLSMEYIDGILLSKTLEDGRLDLKIALKICRQLLEGLAHLHSHGIWHGDFSTDNIMISGFGKDTHAKIIDLGAAINTGRPTDLQPVGKRNNLSPERLTEDSRASMKDDIFSAGIVFYQVLTGHSAFKAQRSHNENSRIPPQLLTEPIQFEQLPDTHDIPLIFKKAIMEMLSREPAIRPTAKSVLESWESLLDTSPVDEICEASAVLRTDSRIFLKQAYLRALKESIPSNDDLDNLYNQMGNFIPAHQLPRLFAQGGLLAPIIFSAIGIITIVLAIGDITSLLF